MTLFGFRSYGDLSIRALEHGPFVELLVGTVLAYELLLTDLLNSLLRMLYCVPPFSSSCSERSARRIFIVCAHFAIATWCFSLSHYTIATIHNLKCGVSVDIVAYLKRRNECMLEHKRLLFKCHAQSQIRGSKKFAPVCEHCSTMTCCCVRYIR